jgi:LysM domain.
VVPSASPTAEASPTVSLSPIPSAGTTIYVVVKGDTLVAIAAKHHLALKALRRANPQITDPTKFQIGEKLTIPTK